MTQSHPQQLAGTHWDPGQYLKFADHRQRPALELLARMPLQHPNAVFDLGCGTGEITRHMADRWPNAEVFGLDNSAEMLETAAQTPSRVTWLEASIEHWRPDVAPDLIYSNATLQWLPDHERLFPRLLSSLAPGGCLAVQMPLSWGMPSHRLIRETLATGGPGGEPLADQDFRDAVGRKWVAETVEYFDWLTLAGARSLDIWETEYLQVLSGADPVLEWVRGTGLRPVLNGLDDNARPRFLHHYSAALQEAYPLREDGTTLYPFRRLFIVATV